MFDKCISTDWSGAGTETDRGDIRVVEADFHDAKATVVNPTVVGARAGTKRWTRTECRQYLANALQDDRPRYLIAVDFGFGYPYGADKAAFGCDGWEEMLGALSRLYTEQGTARSTAQRVNSCPRSGGHGPYRFDDNRTEFRFYLDKKTPYYRMVEIAIPQAISQWYLGSGGTVGFSSITGMATLHHLIGLRDQGEIDFQVWPQEGFEPDDDKHVIVESYPAICPDLRDYGDCDEKDEHCQDAWKVLQWMLTEANSETLESRFKIVLRSFGRVEDVSFEKQVLFEGWVFGVT